LSLPRNPIRRNVPPYRPPTPGGIPGEYRPAPAPPEPASSAPRPLGVGLVLRIEGTWYGLTLVPHEEGSEALRVWRLARATGDRAVYQVIELPWSLGRWACECGDWTFRRDGVDGLHQEGCKHIRGLVDLGMLAPLPWVLATDPINGQVDPDYFDGGAEGDPYDRTPAEVAGAATEGGRR
jgi:hypothetical protein